MVEAMPLQTPEALDEEHEELHEELRRIIRRGGSIGQAAERVAEVLHPHFESENELAIPIVGLLRELAEGRESPDFAKGLKLYEKFKREYPRMLQEHAEIVDALKRLEAVAKKAKNREAIGFARKLKLHAKIEEDLTYPAVLMAGKLLKQR